MEQVEPTTIVKPKYATSVWYYQNDPAYKEKVKGWVKTYNQRRKETADEAVIEKIKEQNRKKSQKKYHTDPEYRARHIQMCRERYQQKKLAKLLTLNTDA
jgi:hypothetical protein